MKKYQIDPEVLPNYRAGENSDYFEERCSCEEGCNDCQGTGWVPHSLYTPLWIRVLKWLIN